MIGAFRFGPLEAVILNEAMSLVVVASAFRAKAVSFLTCQTGPHRQPARRKPARRMAGGRVGDAPQIRNASPRDPGFILEIVECETL